jgi:hypothetical protein
MADFRDREIPVVTREAAVASAAPVKGFAFPNISWAAIFGGVAVGIATHLLLMMFGAAAGLSAVDPQAAEPVGQVPMVVGIWNGISMLISAFVGGYVASRSSGLSRRADGLLHGFVAWGFTTLLFAYLATTALGSVVGGAFSVIGGGVKTAAQTAATVASQDNQAQGQGQNIGSQIQSIITGGDAANPNAEGINAESLQSVQQALRNDDRAGATDILVNDVGLSQERAEQVINQIEPLVTAGPEQVREVADQAVSTVAAGSWWLSIGILLSMLVGLLGGAVGASSSAHRRLSRGHAVPA